MMKNMTVDQLSLKLVVSLYLRVVFPASCSLLHAHVFYKTSLAHSQPWSTNLYEISPSCKD